MNNILKIKNLQKIYHDLNGEIEAIKNITLDINENELISIVGPSGCGKSSLLSILANIEKKSSGEIIFNKPNTKIGYMLQKRLALSLATILENCLVGLEIENKLTEENKKRL